MIFDDLVIEGDLNGLCDMDCDGVDGRESCDKCVLKDVTMNRVVD